MNSEVPTVDSGELDPRRLPAHVAMIMDGNGRWAKKRLLNRVKGHERGADVVRMVVRTSREIGIQALTLYAFSTENWQRPRTEVAALMALLKHFLRSEQQEMLENGIRFNAIGQIHRLPPDVREAIETTRERTRSNAGMVLNLALSYGGRAELVAMVRAIAESVRDGSISADGIDEEMVSAHLQTRDMPDPDLLIRTSGEQRISNFLLWQIAYAEIFFTDTLWPDFTREEYINILKTYQRRERRFGKVDPVAD